MTRRIVLAVLGLIAAILGTVALPLGLLTSAQDHRNYTDGAVTATASVTNLTEEQLNDGTSGQPLHHLIATLAAAGDLISVYDQSGGKIAGTVPVPAVRPAWLTAARTATVPAVHAVEEAIVVVTPVRNDTGTGNIGTVVLARPTGPVEHQIAVLWGLIATVAAAGLVAAGLIAVGLASWVNRPLSALEAAAQQLGDGDLATRSPAGTGPREVRRLAANFNLMAARLEALVHGHQATMADVSHQLRTPLAALRLRLELLAQDSDDIVAGELAGAQEEIGRLSRLVNGLLAVARAEHSTAAPTNVAVDEVVRSRVAAWRPAAEEQGISLTADTLDRAPARMVDGQLEQVLDNLLANSLDALRSGDSISISISAGQVPGKVLITVVDTGPGMTADQKRLAFRRFATGTEGGTGLGLAIVDRLVASNGGTAWLSDTPGGGLTVTIELPVARAEPRPRWLTPGRAG